MIKIVKMTIPTGLDPNDAALKRAVNTGLQAIGVQAYAYWKSIADSELNTSYADYVGSLKMLPSPGAGGLDRIDIGISGFIPMAVEFGTPKFDMKRRLYGSAGTGHRHVQFDLFRRIRVSKKTGKLYAIVPFRHGTEGSAGSRRMHVPPMPIVKQMVGAKRGTVLKGIADRYKTRGTATGYVSQVPRYEKLTKMKSGWHTFRTMSEDSDPNSWIHPGFTAHMIHERVIAHIESTLAPQIIDPLIALLRRSGTTHYHR